MGRPSKKAERQEQILDAFGRVVAVWGLEGATQDRVAEEAGLARALIRHNLGNQEALEQAFIDRYFSQSDGLIQELFRCLDQENPLDSLTDWLFDPVYLDPEFTRISEALLRASARNADLHPHMLNWLENIHKGLEKIIATARPEAAPEAVPIVATGLAALWFNADSLNSLGTMPGHLDASKTAARILISSL